MPSNLINIIDVHCGEILLQTRCPQAAKTYIETHNGELKFQESVKRDADGKQCERGEDEIDLHVAFAK
tara:strand:+ start:2519 stop:2722 length:204 start_codon:yes stop_codon:yes gene_type:complete